MPYGRSLRWWWRRHHRLLLAVVVVPLLLLLAVVGSGWDTEFETESVGSESSEPVVLESPALLDFRPFMLFGFIALVVLGYLLVRHRGVIGLGLIIAMAVGVALFGLLAGGLERGEEGQELPDGLASEPGPETTRADPPPWALIVGFGVVAVAGLVVVFARATGVPPPDEDDDGDAVADAVAEIADELRLDRQEPRAAIVAMYARLENRLAREGRSRDRDETTAEFSQRVLEGLGARGDACRDLARLYQRVGFGEVEASPADRDAAVDLLDRISVEVAEGADAGGPGPTAATEAGADVQI